MYAIRSYYDSEVAREAVINKVKENNIDALMIVTLFNKTQEERWVNNNNFSWGGTGYYGTPLGLHGSYYDYYAYSIGTIYNDGVITSYSIHYTKLYESRPSIASRWTASPSRIRGMRRANCGTGSPARSRQGSRR